VNKKRKQHYVPRFYLDAWAINNQIWCKSEEKIFLAALENVANIRDFYRLKPISQKAHELIEYFVELIQEPLRENVRELMNTLSSICNIYENQRIIEERDKFTEEEDIYINNVLENFYSHIEGMAAPCLYELQRGKVEFYNDLKKSLSFLLFLCMQFNRTEKVKRNIYSLVSQHFHDGYPIVSIAIAFWLSSKMYTEEWMITILQNKADEVFITGDQPVINLNKPRSMDEEYEEMILYYPISPKYAILLSKGYGRRVLTIQVSTEAVTFYNNLIYSNSYRSIYSIDKDSLARF